MTIKFHSYLDANNEGDTPNDAVGNQGAAILISYINDTRSMLAAMNLGSMPVGTADAGSYFNTEVLQVVDYGVRLANLCLAVSLG